jgi:type IV pilus assembly protein PilX
MSKFAFATAANRIRQPRQSGVVLVVVLLFMLALTTIAVFGSRNATMGERQARNESEYQVARQAAEAALRDAERDLYPDAALAPPNTPACTRSATGVRSDEHSVYDIEFTTTCLGGQCGFPASDTRNQVTWAAANTSTPGAAWWPVSKGGLWTPAGSSCADYAGAVPLGRYTGVAPLGGVSRQPDYLIEYIGDPTQGSAQKGYQCDTVLIGSSLDAYNAADELDPSGGKFKPSCHLFRITARGFGPSANTQVLVQSYFSIVIPESVQ